MLISAILNSKFPENYIRRKILDSFQLQILQYYLIIHVSFRLCHAHIAERHCALLSAVEGQGEVLGF